MGAIDNLDKSVGVIGKIADIFKKNGYAMAFFSILTFGLALGCIVSYKVLTMDKSVNEILVKHDNDLAEQKTTEHVVKTEMRRDAQVDVYDVLDDLMNKLDADRVYVVEMHNGNNNPSGLPFIYGEMTYEKSRLNIDDIDDEYTSVTLSRYQLPIYLSEHRYFLGTSDELKEIDSKIYKRIYNDSTTYVIMMAISGVNGDVGMFGVSYCFGHEPASLDVINTNMSLASQKLTHLLDRHGYPKK